MYVCVSIYIYIYIYIHIKLYTDYYITTYYGMLLAIIISPLAAPRRSAAGPCASALRI